MNASETTLFVLSAEDANVIAQKRYGRDLTEDELYDVRKMLEWGLECWYEVMVEAVDLAVKEPRSAR
jgi:hypothetical protein